MINMPKTKAEKSGSKPNIQWSDSSLARIFELKPYLRDAFSASNTPVFRERFSNALDAGDSDGDHEARNLVTRWGQLAYDKSDAMLLSKPTNPTKQDIRKLFFGVQWDLLNGRPGPGKDKIKTARKKLNLNPFKPSDSLLEACLTAPLLPEEEHIQTNSAPEVNVEGNAACQVLQSFKRAGELKASSSGVTEIPDVGQDATAAPEPMVPIEDDSNPTLESIVQSNVPTKPSDDVELEASNPPTPSLVDDVSMRSANSEVNTPSTIPRELPKVPKGTSNGTRRHKRGSSSRARHNKKKIPATTTNQPPSIKIENAAEDTVDKLDTNSEKAEKPTEKFTKKPKKQKKWDTSGPGQSMRRAVQLSLQTYAEENRPDEKAATPPCTAHDSPSPETGNALQLDLGSQLDSQSGDQTEPASNQEVADVKPWLAAPSCFESSQQHLASSTTFPALRTSSPAPPEVSPSPPATPFPNIPTSISPPDSPPKASTAIVHHAIHKPQSEIASLSTLPTPTLAGACANEIRIPVWAVSRQELCELPYFKAMQGGVYSRAHTVYGYLLGRFPSPRDAWRHDGRLIISHGGGKNMANEEQPLPDDLVTAAQSKHQLGDDQLETDSSIRGLLTSYRMFRPIIILAEAGYEHLQRFNLKRGHAREANYYVLGHYAIVAAWAEREEINSQGETSLYTRWKFAFQWIEQSQGPPWWLATSETATQIARPLPTEREYQSGNRQPFNKKVSPRRFKPSELALNPFPSSGAENRCLACSTVSPKVYRMEWVCLNPDCESFWTLSNGLAPRGELQFDEDFLSIRDLPIQLQKIPYPIVPEYPGWEYQANNCSIFNRNFWAGVCCHRCGRVSCRQRWQIWECPACKLVVEESRPRIYSSSILDDPLSWETYGNGRFNPTEITATCKVVNYPEGESRVAVYYQLPDDIGQIVHVLNNPVASKTPDDLFEQYQKDACERDMFQRHAMKTHGVKGELYAQHFTFNAGAPYKYVAEAASTPFEQCPESIRNAVDHIKYLCEGALGPSDTQFNELLSVAYAEGQEMNFHSDDEPGLGPVVAGLTLGSSAEMMFRHNLSVKKNQTYKNGPYRASESRTIEVQNERTLQITLSHGDLLIMNGTKIQQQFEHAVFVRDTDLLRFAATARSINAGKVINSSTSPGGRRATSLIDTQPGLTGHLRN
ncbi:hypothetical protein FRC09_002989 [Ceratobasidium sp. 395]|nr:hypothetical protein FRC09_002989 [Ceratobasidium sp. 395]